MFALLATTTYIWMHNCLKCNYIRDIRPQVSEAVRLYAVRRHDVTGALVLSVGSTPYEAEATEPGPLGIGTLPQARGVLNQAAAVVEEYNLELSDYVRGLLSRFFLSPNTPHYMSMGISATRLASTSDGSSTNEASCVDGDSSSEVQFRLRVPVESFARIRQEHPSEQTLDALIDLIRNAIPVQVTAGKRPEVLETQIDGGEHCLVKQTIVAISKRQEELRKDFEDLFDVVATGSDADCPCAETDADCAAGTGAATVPDETVFHRRLREVAERNTGFFWTSGRFAWFEIMMLAVLGVITRQLVLFGKAYATRASSKQMWHPRESVRTLMQLAVAPLFALVIIWILTVTSLIVVKPMIGDMWANGIMPIAFLLGLFPTLGYNVLHSVAQGLFGRSLVDEEQAQASPKPIPDPPPDAPEGTPASFVRLIQRVRHHATAVFR